MQDYKNSQGSCCDKDDRHIFQGIKATSSTLTIFLVFGKKIHDMVMDKFQYFSRGKAYEKIRRSAYRQKPI